MAAFSLGALRRSIRSAADRQVLEPAGNKPPLERIARD
jgi:hypothetical protein